MNTSRDPGSFRDPSGFVFRHGGRVYRQVNHAGAERYRSLLDSGLYEDLTRASLLVGHQTVDVRLPDAPPAHEVLLPEQIPFISYPYEWSFGQLKAAAQLTLEVQRRALARGQILRDASAFNVQFIGTHPIFIDTLSFAPYTDGPWVAYRQFCQHFLAPLALMAFVDPQLGQLSRTHIDGVPLSLAAALLPMRARMKPGLLMHLHLHARSEARTEGAPSSAQAPKAAGRMGRTAMLGLVDSLSRTVSQLAPKGGYTLWSTYDTHLNYSSSAQDAKRQAVRGLLERIKQAAPLETVWDVGANTGEYSAIAADAGARVVSLDGDYAVVDRHFAAASARKDRRILPLVQDLANPSPAMGWHHAERQSLVERGPADAAMALALVHHLAIGGNVPLPRVAAFFHAISRHLIVEFVPKDDSQVQRMLALREDVFDDYTKDGFERAFAEYFEVLHAQPIEGTVRTLYLMARR